MKIYGITPEKCASVGYKTSQEAPKTQATVNKENTLRAEIATMLAEVFTDPKERSNQLEMLSSFEGKDGSMISGLRSPKELSNKRLFIVHKKVKDWHTETVAGWDKK